MTCSCLSVCFHVNASLSFFRALSLSTSCTTSTTRRLVRLRIAFGPSRPAIITIIITTINCCAVVIITAITTTILIQLNRLQNAPHAHARESEALFKQLLPLLNPLL